MPSITSPNASQPARERSHQDKKKENAACARNECRRLQRHGWPNVRACVRLHAHTCVQLQIHVLARGYTTHIFTHVLRRHISEISVLFYSKCSLVTANVKADGGPHYVTNQPHSLRHSNSFSFLVSSYHFFCSLPWWRQLSNFSQSLISFFSATLGQKGIWLLGERSS